jgi:hypothetical protein
VNEIKILTASLRETVRPKLLEITGAKFDSPDTVLVPDSNANLEAVAKIMIAAGCEWEWIDVDEDEL